MDRSVPMSNGEPSRRSDGIQAAATRQRRSEILDAAVGAFTAFGYNGTSLRDVATRAGMSHTGLLHHYADKIALLEAVLDDRLAGATASFALDSRDGETFIRALVQVAHHDVTDPTTIALFTKLAAESTTPSHPAHAYFTRWYATIRDRLEEAFTDLDHRGLYLGTIPPHLAALQTAAVRDGLNLQWLLAPTEINLVDAIRTHFLAYVELDL
jgi:AcrR family transcriptional regulator